MPRGRCQDHLKSPWVPSSSVILQLLVLVLSKSVMGWRAIPVLVLSLYRSNPIPTSTITITTSWPGYFRQPDKMRIKHDLQARVGCYRIWPEYYLSKEEASVWSFSLYGAGPLQNTQMEGTEKLSVSPNHSTRLPDGHWKIRTSGDSILWVSMWEQCPFSACQLQPKNIRATCLYKPSCHIEYPQTWGFSLHSFPIGLDSHFLLSVFFFLGAKC